MFDTHVNLHADAFEDDLSDVLDRARSSGVRRMLSICDRLSNFERVLGIATSNEDIWCSAGVHPHHAKDYPELTADQLIACAEHAKVVAIGETGLDFHYGYSPENDQIRSVRTHIEAAQTTGLPLILHTREADDLMGDILEETFAVAPFKPLLHCYTGGERLAERALALGGYVSVSGILSFKNAKNVRDVIQTVPLERLILETDCPYLSPMPLRGRRNEPSHLIHVAEALAAVKGVSIEDVKRITEENAVQFFHRVSEPA